MGEVPLITAEELRTLAIATVAGPLLRRELPSVFRKDFNCAPLDVEVSKWLVPPPEQQPQPPKRSNLQFLFKSGPPQIKLTTPSLDLFTKP